MAIFERFYYQQQYNDRLDDTQVISCFIETSQEINGHTEYVLRVQRGPLKENSWRILRRYNDFYRLHKYFCKSNIKLSFPGKRIFGNMRPDFIAERQQTLQRYINTILMNPILASSLPAKRFIDPDSYSQSFQDQAIQNTLLCLRHENLWSLGASYGAIGWRLRKHYFKVTPKPPAECKSSNKLLTKSTSSQSYSYNKSATTANNHHNATTANSSTTTTTAASAASIDFTKLEGNELVLEWLEFGPDKYIDDKDLTAILKSLMALQHPHIESIIYAANNECGCLVIRKFHKHGTLKDILCMATPKNTFLQKYGNPKGRTALTMKKVANYGKQILEALIFLHSKGFPYGHLHSGNIVIIDDCVKLLDIENYILGVPAFYRPFFVQHSKIFTSEFIDVYCFGHVLFEMTMGYPLQESVIRQITDCPENLKNLLESILSRDACKGGLPTLQQLLKHPFFEEHTYCSSSSNNSTNSTINDEDIVRKNHFKLPLNVKDRLKDVIQKTENRLRDEQKSVKNQKRIVRVQELMSSEEEKRKSRQKAKHEHKQNKLKQQSSLHSYNERIPLALTGAAFTEYKSINLSTDAGKQQDNLASLDTSSPPTPTSSLIQKTPSKDLGMLEQQQQQVEPIFKQMTRLASVERQSSAPSISSRDRESSHGPLDHDDYERSVFLESICKFNRGSLRKVRSND